jgi:glycosyltransferase involved in cell wall biosynthesis
MRIAHVSDCYLPRLGGIEVQVTELTRRQSEAGESVDVITATPGHEVRAGVERLGGVTVHRVTARMPFELPVHPRTRAHVAPLLRDVAPDVVHVHLGVVSPFAWGGIRAAVEVGLPVLVTVHSVWGKGSQAAYAAVDRLARWTAKGVQPAAVSRVAADRIAASLGSDVPVLVTPNGVDATEWNAAARVPRDDADAPVRFVTAMRLAPRKRAMPLLKMFAAARGGAVPRQVRLAIAGAGPQRQRLERYALEHGLAGDVAFLGRLSRPDLRETYLASDVFVQPSVMESFGLAALEARATGLPVIARSQTGLTEFVTDEVEGLLVDDDAGMAQAMARIALDDELRLKLTRHNMADEPQQTWPNVLTVVREAYDAAIARSPARTDG